MNIDYNLSLERKLVKRKPVGLINNIKFKKIMSTLSKEQLKSFEFPCYECLVSTSCNKYCYVIFKYMNYIADHLPKMTADEIFIYRNIVPIEVIKYIEKMLKTKSRLAHPNL